MAILKSEEIINTVRTILKSLECAICLEPMQTPMSTGCGHFFCRFCITELLNSKYRAPCPLCKKSFTRRSVQEVIQRQSIVVAARKLAVTCENIIGIKFFSKTREDLVSSKAEEKTAKENRKVSKKRKSEEIHTDGDESKTEHITHIANKKEVAEKEINVSNSASSEDEILPTNKCLVPQDLDTFRTLPCTVPIQKMVELDQSNPALFFHPPKKSYLRTYSRKALKHDNKTHIASVLSDSSKEMSCEVSHPGKKIKDDESTESQNLPLISENPVVVNNMKIRRKSRLNLKASEQKKKIMNKNRLNALKNKTNEVDKDKYIINDDSFLSKASKKDNDLKRNNTVGDELAKENDGKFISSPKRAKNVKHLEKNNDTPCIKKSRGRSAKRGKRLVKVTTPISNLSADEETVYLRLEDAENHHLPVINDSVGEKTPKRRSFEKECFNLNEIDISPKTSNHPLKTVVAAEPSELLESEMCPDTAISVYSVASPEANKTVLSHKSPGWSRVKAIGKDFRMKKFSRLNIEKNLPHVLLKDINADDSMQDTVTSSKTDVVCYSNETENVVTKPNFDINDPSAAKDNCYKNLACQSSQAENEHDEGTKNTEINLISDCHPERESGKELTKKASTVFGQSNQQCSESARSSSEENIFATKVSGLTNQDIVDVHGGETSSENTGEFVITSDQNNEIECRNLNKQSDTNSLITMPERSKSSDSLPVSLECNSHAKGDKRKDTEVSFEAVSAFTGDLNYCPVGLSGNVNSIAEDRDKNSMQAEESLMDIDIVNANDSEIFEPDPLHLKNFISKKCNEELKHLYKSAAVNVEVLHEINKKLDKSTSFQPSDVQNKNEMNTSNEVDSHFSKFSKSSVLESALHDDEEDDIRYIEHSQQTSQRFYNICDNTGIRQNNLLSVVQKESMLLSVRDAAFKHEASLINLKERDQKGSCQNFSFTNVPKTKVVKRTCLTLEEIQDAFVKSNMSGQTEPICCLPFLARDFKLDICVSEETLNISVLKVIESGEVAQDNALFSEKNIQTSNCNMPLNSPLAIELSSNVESDASILEECNPPKKFKNMLDSLPCLNNYTIDPQNALQKHSSLLHHEENVPEPSADVISPQHKRLLSGFSKNVMFEDLPKVTETESVLNQPEKNTSEIPVCSTSQKQTNIEQHSEISEKKIILPELQQCSVEIPNSEQEQSFLNKLEENNPEHLICTSSSQQKNLLHFESSNDVVVGNVPKNDQSHTESRSSKQVDHSLNQLAENIPKHPIHVIPPQHEKQDLQSECNVIFSVIPKTNQSSDTNDDVHDIHCLLVKVAETNPRINKSTEKSQPCITVNENFAKSPDTDVLRQKTVEVSHKESTNACSNNTSKSKISFSLNKEDSDLSFSQSSTEECDPFQLNASFYRIRSVPSSNYKQIDEDLSSDPDMAFANEMVAPLRNLAEKMDPCSNKMSKDEHEKREKVDEFTSLNDSDKRDCSGNLDLLEKLVSSGNKKTSQKSSRLSLRLRNNKSSKFKRIKSNDSTDDSDEELLLENKKSSKKICSEPSDKCSNTVLEKSSDKSSPSRILNSAVSIQSSDVIQTHDTMKDNTNSTLSEEIPDGNASEIIMEIEDLDKKIKSLEEKLKQCGQGELLAARGEQTVLKGKGSKEHSKTSDNIIHLDDSDDSTDLFPQSVPPTPPQLLAHDKDPKSSYKSFYNHN